LLDGRAVWHALAMAYWTGAHTKHRLQYHLVWIPKYRKRVLRGMLAGCLKQSVYHVAVVNRWKIKNPIKERVLPHFHGRLG